MSDIRVNLCGVTLKNPVIAASGTFGYGMEYNEFYSISRLGGISCKGTAIGGMEGKPHPRYSRKPRRACSTASGAAESRRGHTFKHLICPG